MLPNFKKTIITIIAFFLISGALIASAAFIETLVTAANSDQDFATNILGANNADNDFDSSLVTANEDGSILEMLEFISSSIDFNCGDTIYDTDSNSYGTVQIGSQCWMAENLNIGTKIAGASNQTDNGTIEKYCYNDDDANCTTDGGLYQWDEMMQYSETEGVQGICPTGWHIPTDAEYYTLENYLATGTCDADRNGVWDCSPAGTELKTGGSSGFNALFAGNRNTDGSFYNISSYANFWSSTVSGSGAWRRGLGSSNSTVYRDDFSQMYGFSVRCLKD